MSQADEKREGLLPEADLVLRKTRELTDFLCATEDYRHYQDSLIRLKNKRESYRKFNEFRKKNLFLDEKEEDYTNRLDALYEEYKDILMDPAVMEFLAAEEHVNMMLRRVFNCIAEDMRIDISYMD